MKSVKVCATSANLGPGFDTLGIALGLYNEYGFKESEEYELVGFDSRFDISHNLVLASYKKLFEYFGLPPKPIHIEQLHQDIPVSRGLGSSSACIVAGLRIANEIIGNRADVHGLLKLASTMEGHPDNVAPALLGGLVVSSLEEGEVRAKRLRLSPDLVFTLLIPPFELSTSLARGALPKSVSMKDATRNIAHALFLIKGLEEGDIGLIKDCIHDYLHVPYRLPLIEGAKEVMEKVSNLGAAITISGAGSTLIAISKNSIVDKLIGIVPASWGIREAKVETKGSEANG
ncbi:MAG: homoserine kinase [Bacilli bacterium]|nr:homoserine kinase [Bacilli bacterium]